MTTFPTSSTSSIDSTTILMSPTRATTHPTVTGFQSFPKPSKAPVYRSDPSSTDTNRLSTLVIVVIAVSGVTAVIIALAVPCYIWRKRRNTRLLFTIFQLQIIYTCIQKTWPCVVQLYNLLVYFMCYGNVRDLNVYLMAKKLFSFVLFHIIMFTEP